MTAQTHSLKADIDRRGEEQKVFRQITEELIDAESAGSRDFDFYAALHRNNTLWNALKRDVALQTNRLPEDLRDMVVSLADWVELQTSRVLHGDGQIKSLIVVNRNVIDGLA